MNKPHDALPVLTDVIQAGLDSIDQHASRSDDWRYTLLRAQLPDLFEQALQRVRPQLMSEFESLLKQTLEAAQTHNQERK